MRSPVILLLALAASLHAQGAFANPDFEKGSPGAVPEGWFVPSAFAAYKAVWVGEGCRQGKGCAEIAPGPDAERYSRQPYADVRRGALSRASRSVIARR